MPTSRAQALALAIEETISEEKLLPGAPLGTIEDWRVRSGFARATVNEALRLVADRGIAEIKPGRGGGIFVSMTGPVVRLRHTLLTAHGQATTLADAIVIREALEPLIALDAARHRTPSQMTEVHSALSHLNEAMDDHGSFLRSVWQIHEAIAMITPNEMLRAVYLAVLQVIRERSELAISDALNEERHRSHRWAVHQRLVEAIESGDLDKTAGAIREHAALDPL